MPSAIYFSTGPTSSMDRPLAHWRTARLEQRREHWGTQLRELRARHPEAWRLLGIGEAGPIEREFGRLQDELQQIDLELSRRKPRAGSSKSTVARPVLPHIHELKHSTDFTSLEFKGERYTLTSRQAQVVQMLHEAHESGMPEVSKDRILEKLGTSASRLRDTFRSTQGIWRNLIVPGTKRGTYRLDLSRKA